ncbi:hypothetical protein M0802_007498 [Mischocyttarus mexicanus]|nr:hypothetical protein M0802_007498 [Mischocyttarus mexicanus]
MMCLKQKDGWYLVIRSFDGTKSGEMRFTRLRESSGWITRSSGFELKCNFVKGNCNCNDNGNVYGYGYGA